MGRGGKVVALSVEPTKKHIDNVLRPHQSFALRLPIYNGMFSAALVDRFQVAEGVRAVVGNVSSAHG